MLSDTHVLSKSRETEWDTLNPESLDRVYDYETDDDNDIRYLTGSRD